MKQNKKNASVSELVKWLFKQSEFLSFIYKTKREKKTFFIWTASSPHLFWRWPKNWCVDPRRSIAQTWPDPSHSWGPEPAAARGTPCSTTCTQWRVAPQLQVKFSTSFGSHAIEDEHHIHRKNKTQKGFRCTWLPPSQSVRWGISGPEPGSPRTRRAWGRRRRRPESRRCVSLWDLGSGCNEGGGINQLWHWQGCVCNGGYINLSWTPVEKPRMKH